MRNRDLENKLKTAAEHATPDVWDGVLSGLTRRKETVNDMTLQPMKRKKTWIWAAGLAAALLLCLGAVGFGQYNLYHTVDSIIALDVNPSIELKVNGQEKVLEAAPLNDDAAGILDGMDLRGAGLDVAVNALIGSMLKNGYIDELANSILVSVETNDPAKSAALKQRLAEEIGQVLQSSAVDGAVLSQAVSEDEALRALADKHHISLGKAALIEQMRAQNTLLRFEDLAQLSINELNLLASSQQAALPNVTATGAASDKAYISMDEAKQRALDHAGVQAGACAYLRAELDCDDGRMVYDVEFYVSETGVEHEMELDARTGDILESKQEREGQPGQDPPEAVPAGRIGSDKALSLALAHAGVAAADATVLDLDFDGDDGRAAYELEFLAGGKEYEYRVDAVTGDILGWKIETRDHGGAPSEPIAPQDGSSDAQPDGSGAQQTGYIGQAKAKELALSRAGVAAADAVFDKVEFDWDDGVPQYEVEFRAGRLEVQVDIHAETGAVLEYESEYDD